MHSGLLKMWSQIKRRKERSQGAEGGRGEEASPGVLMGFTRGRGEGPPKKWEDWRGKEKKKRGTFTQAPCPGDEADLGPGAAEAACEE